MLSATLQRRPPAAELKRMADQTFMDIFNRLNMDEAFRAEVKRDPAEALSAFRLTREQAEGVALRGAWSGRVRALPIFGKLTASEFAHVLTRMEEGFYRPGEILMLQGDPGDWFHYLTEGKVEVLQTPAGQDVSKAKRIDTLGAGEHVGETALRFNTARNATVRAMTNVRTLSLEAHDFRELFRRLAVA